LDRKGARANRQLDQNAQRVDRSAGRRGSSSGSRQRGGRRTG
jgi:hypothetical protein